MTSLLLAALLALAPQDVKYPPKPGPREFIVDEAKVVSAEDAAEIKILCDEVLTKRKAPVIVVTIPSLAAYGAQGWSIDTYAGKLFGEWGIGWADTNYGMLLLVSIGDRKARIELGDSWSHRKNEEAKRVLSERVIPRFKQGETSRGIREGVRGLHDLALDQVRAQPRTGPATQPAPVPPSPDYSSPGAGGGGVAWGGCGLIVLIVVGLIIVMAVSRLFRRSVRTWDHRGPYGGGYYGGGYGGGFGSGFGGGILGGILGGMIGNQIGRRYDDRGSAPPPSYGGGDSSSSSDSSDFGGGSFGGGFSGGGGATGEW